MPGEPYTDRDRDQNRRTSSHSDYNADVNRSRGHDIHRRAQVLDGQLIYRTNARYPGFEGCMTTETKTDTLCHPHHTTLSPHHLPDILIPGKRPTSKNASRYTPQVSANLDIEIPLSDIRGSEHQSRTEVYELPASTHHPTHLNVQDAVSDPHETVSSLDNVHRSSFELEFGYLGLCIASSAAVAERAPQAGGGSEFAYLAGYINPGSIRQSTNVASPSPGEEDLDDVSKFIDGDPALLSSPTLSSWPQYPPPSPSPSPPSTPTLHTCLPPKSPAYRDLLTEHFPLLPLTATPFPESDDAVQDFRAQKIESSSSSSSSSSPPPLPPKPAPYRRARDLAPIDYEAYVEAKYYRSVSQRGRWRGEQVRGYDGVLDEEECD